MLITRGLYTGRIQNLPSGVYFGIYSRVDSWPSHNQLGYKMKRGGGGGGIIWWLTPAIVLRMASHKRSIIYHLLIVLFHRASDLDHVIFRMGMLAVLRSKVKKGE